MLYIFLLLRRHLSLRVCVPRPVHLELQAILWTQWVPIESNHSRFMCIRLSFINPQSSLTSFVIHHVNPRHFIAIWVYFRWSYPLGQEEGVLSYTHKKIFDLGRCGIGADKFLDTYVQCWCTVVKIYWTEVQSVFIFSCGLVPLFSVVFCLVRTVHEFYFRLLGS